MGVSVVVIDIGKAPFGHNKIQRSNMEEIFVQQLRILFNKKVDAFDNTVRNDPAAFHKKLSSCKLVESHAVPTFSAVGGYFGPRSSSSAYTLGVP
jgi:hypothetical protein